MMNDEKKSIRCSFCGKHEDQVDRIIAGPGAYICNECVQLCMSLLDDAAAVFLLPLPGAAQEAFAPDILFGEAFLLHLLDDLDLRRDGRVVAAGEIEGGIPLHTLEADEGVDDGVVQRMAQVQLPRDVGGRDDDGEGDLVLVRLGAEIARVHPVLVQPLLEIFGIVCLLHFHIPPFPARPLPARTGLFAPKNAHTAQFYL